jgi:hypothetical protein
MAVVQSQRWKIDFVERETVVSNTKSEKIHGPASRALHLSHEPTLPVVAGTRPNYRQYSGTNVKIPQSFIVINKLVMGEHHQHGCK